MRLSFWFGIEVMDLTSDVVIEPPAELSGRMLSEGEWIGFLDFEIADFGVAGGNIELHASGRGIGLAVVYWLADGFPENLIPRLKEITIGQLADGVGEGGFEVELDGKSVLVYAITDGLIRQEMLEDGRVVPKPSEIAMAARDGRISDLEVAIANHSESVDILHQGCSGLQSAIRSGHVAAAKLLISAGADVNLFSSMASTPLHLCALSRSLNDDQACELATRLLEAGANPNYLDEHQRPPAYFAERRKKYALVALLQGGKL